MARQDMRLSDRRFGLFVLLDIVCIKRYIYTMSEPQPIPSGEANAAELLNDPAWRREASSAAFNVFLRLADKWALKGEQATALLGALPRPTFQKWKRAAGEGKSLTLDRDQLERISLCLGVEKGLKTVFADESAGLRWLKAVNRDAPFYGASPLERMTKGGIVALHGTRQYLDAWRGVR